jgi:hypothetical protein
MMVKPLPEVAMAAVLCPHCGKTLRVPDGYRRPAARCPACWGVVPLPFPPAESATAILPTDAGPRPRRDLPGWAWGLIGTVAWGAAAVGLTLAVPSDHLWDVAGWLLFFLAALAGMCLYLLGTLIAVGRRHPNTPAIAALNILLGWTFLGWAAAVVWSLTRFDPPPRGRA